MHQNTLKNLKTSIVSRIVDEGEKISVRGLKTKEIIGTDFTIRKLLNTRLDHERKRYVDKKITEISPAFTKALQKLSEDKNSRESVFTLSLDHSENELPNCLVLYQVLIRKKKAIVLVYSRSLDVKNKLEQDIELSQYIARETMRATNSSFGYIKFFVGSIHIYID